MSYNHRFIPPVSTFLKIYIYIYFFVDYTVDCSDESQDVCMLLFNASGELRRGLSMWLTSVSMILYFLFLGSQYVFVYIGLLSVEISWAGRGAEKRPESPHSDT